MLREKENRDLGIKYFTYCATPVWLKTWRNLRAKLHSHDHYQSQDIEEYATPKAILTSDSEDLFLVETLPPLGGADGCGGGRTEGSCSSLHLQRHAEPCTHRWSVWTLVNSWTRVCNTWGLVLRNSLFLSTKGVHPLAFDLWRLGEDDVILPFCLVVHLPGMSHRETIVGLCRGEGFAV